jgi:hypothetical protein
MNVFWIFGSSTAVNRLELVKLRLLGEVFIIARSVKGQEA